MIRVIDITIAHTFYCETEEGANAFVEAIKLMGHDYKVIHDDKEKPNV